MPNIDCVLYKNGGNAWLESLALLFTRCVLWPTVDVGTSYSYSGPDQTDRVQAGGTSFINGKSGISSQTDAGGTTYYTNDSSGRLIDERTPSGVYYYLFDGLGSVVGLTDTNGTLVATYQYDPYGNLASSTGSIANPWRFAGGYLDANTGLYKFGQRYYDPTLGRWSQQDRAGGSSADPTSLNRYVYASDDPVNRVDPNGTCSGSPPNNATVHWWGIKFYLNDCYVNDLTFGLTAGAIGHGTLAGFTEGLVARLNLFVALIEALSVAALVWADAKCGGQGVYVDVFWDSVFTIQPICSGSGPFFGS